MSERSEGALGGIALSRLKLGARLMMRGKGDTYRKGKDTLILEKKMSTCQSTKANYQR